MRIRFFSFWTELRKITVKTAAPLSCSPILHGFGVRLFDCFVFCDESTGVTTATFVPGTEQVTLYTVIIYSIAFRRISTKFLCGRWMDGLIDFPTNGTCWSIDKPLVTNKSCFKLWLACPISPFSMTPNFTKWKRVKQEQFPAFIHSLSIHFLIGRLPRKIHHF